MAESTATTRRKTAPAIDQLLELVAAANENPDSPEAEKVNALLGALLPDTTAGDPEQKPRNVIEAILAVMRDVRAVGKNGENEDQHYKFRGIDDTVNALGPAMRRHGLIVAPVASSTTYERIEVGARKTLGGRAEVSVTYRFHHSDDQGAITTLDTVVPGESIDYGDKAVAKAMSVAYRICLLQTFTLPTCEPDPDQQSYDGVRPATNDAPPPLDAETVANAAHWASDQLDYEAAFGEVRERLTVEALSGVTLQTKDGRTLPGDQWLTYAEQQTREFRARREAEQQDAAAQGPTRAQEPAQDAQPAQEQRAPEPSPADADRFAQEARAAHDEAQARAKSAPKETGAQRATRLALDEAAFQCEVLNLRIEEHLRPILRDASDLTSVLMSKAPRHLVGFRPQVIAALRQRGDATMADAYERKGEGFPLVLEDVTEAGEPDRQPANA